MLVTKEITECPKCHREFDVSKTWRNYDHHALRHFNPSSRLCTAWYKPYFKKLSAETSISTLTNEEFYFDKLLPRYQYEEHLKEHGITEQTKA